MLIKTVLLFLAVLGAIVWIGSKLHVPLLPQRKSAKALRCKSCGTPRIGKGACPCGRA